MKSEDEAYIEIERFLNNLMEKDEQKSFEQQLIQDPELNHKVKLQSLANDLVLKNRLGQLANYSKELQYKGIKQQQYIRYAKIGAVIVAASLSAYFFMKPSEKPLSITKTQDSVFTANVDTNTAPNNPIINSPKIIDEQHVVTEKTNTTTVEITKNQEVAPTSRAVEIVIEEPKVISNQKTEPIVAKPAPQQEKDVLAPCHNVALKAHIETFKTCIGENEGAISVSQVQGGHKPYTYKVVSHADHDEKSLAGLAAGSYSLTIADSKGCSHTYDPIIVSSKDCNIDVQFNPQLGEIWELPSTSQTGELSIYDERGRLIYHKLIPAMDKTSWDGKNQYGQLQSGIFVYLLKYTDGTQKQGNITVLQ